MSLIPIKKLLPAINTDNPKQWWVPVWTGLIMDQQAKHYQKMKNAVWLYLYLLLNADRNTGCLVRKVKTITADMGISRDMVLRWLNVLRQGEYIATRSNGRCLAVRILKWKTLSEVGNTAYQKPKISNPRGWKNPTSQRASNSRKTLMLSHKKQLCVAANDITIKKDIYNDNIEIGNKNILEMNSDTLERFEPRDRQEILAWDLAKGLNDRKGLALYLSYSRKYSESLLRRVMGEVREVPNCKIRKSRGALFNYLINRYVQETNYSPGS